MGDRITTIRSNGEPSARGYARVPLPQHAPHPPAQGARVMIADPRLTATVCSAPASSGPRNPEQRELTQPLGIDLPDGLPLTKAQRFWIDPELLAAWEEEKTRKNP